ncbi:MAG: protein kinase [Chloroflexi bacterium]|nr:protein kinase [Chloroflexota bacterium]
MATDLSGQIFGHYKLQEILGTGGMSLVYRARQTNIDRDVAIKIMAPALSSQQNFARRFKQEAEVFAKLEHPHIVPIYDYDQHEKYLYLVLRLIPGGSLTERLDKEGKDFPLALAAKIVEQVADGLAYAHENKIIHRDLKPGNILLDNDDNAYIMDFGIAKVITETKGGAMSALLGTPAYIAPEQWQSGIIDARADIYSLGVVVYRMLTGELPFSNASPFYLMYSHLHEATPHPSHHKDTIPPAIDDVVLKALAKRPDERYQSVKEFATAFTNAVKEHSASKPEADTQALLDTSGRRAFRPESKRDSRLDKLWVALERNTGHMYVTPDVDELFDVKSDRQFKGMEDIFDELERPSSSSYNTRRLSDLLEQIKKEQSFLGIKAQRVKLPQGIAEKFDRESGLLVIAIDPDSPAASAGLFMGDLIINLDGEPMKHQDDLISVLDDTRIDKSVQIDYLRTGELHKAAATLVKRHMGKSTL